MSKEITRDLKDEIREIAQKARAATSSLSDLSSEHKNKALREMARMILRRAKTILKENKKDLLGAEKAGYPKAFLDRLQLNEKSLQEMAQGLEEVALLPDPVGEVTGLWLRPNGLQVGRMRIPLGVIGFIYESRPNVTVDAAGLCLKSGNAVILKGGSEALRSNLILTQIMQEVLVKGNIPAGAIQIISTPDRTATAELLKLEEYIDLVIPRGGEGLIRMVMSQARMPVLKHYKGVCHVFVDKSAELNMAYEICLNAKVQRPGVCNAMETLLVHQDIAPLFLPEMIQQFQREGVEIRGCPQTLKLIRQGKGIKAAEETDWGKEYLDLILAVKVVKGLKEAKDHIEQYGSKHTEAIVTSDYNRSREFLRSVDSSVVLVNASTRFNDGNQLGLGAEIGISTTKLHAFGPMGLTELTTTKFIVFGDGQIRK